MQVLHKTRTLIDSLKRDQRGSIVPIAAIAFTVLMGFAALAIDVGMMTYQKSRLQVTADSAALAAASAYLKSDNDLSTSGYNYANAVTQHNMPAERFGSVLTKQNIEFGVWDKKNKRFLPPGSKLIGGSSNGSPAARATTVMSKANGNAMPVFLLKAFGYDTMDINASAVAVVSQGSCLNDGLKAGGKVTMGQDVGLSSDLCVYGKKGVQFGQDAVIKAPAMVGAPSLSDIRFGQNPKYPEGALFAADLNPTSSGEITSLIDDLENHRDLPPEITTVNVVNKLPKKLNSGTAYVVNGNVKLGQDYSLKNVVIAAKGTITFGQGAKILNTADCSNNGKTVGLYATGNIKLGQDAKAEGVEIRSGNNVIIQQDIRGISAIVEAANNITVGQDPKLTTCKSAFPRKNAGSVGASVQLVY